MQQSRFIYYFYITTLLLDKLFVDFWIILQCYIKLVKSLIKSTSYKLYKINYFLNLKNYLLKLIRFLK